MKPLDKLALAQVNRRFKKFREVLPYSKVRGGWIKFTRQSLNMTLKKLAERSGVSLQTVAQAERTEAAGKITLATLKSMAEAMNCELIYAFAPKQDIDKMMKTASTEKAMQIIASASRHMDLEDQTVKISIQERIKRLAEKLFMKGDIW